MKISTNAVKILEATVSEMTVKFDKLENEPKEIRYIKVTKEMIDKKFLNSKKKSIFIFGAEARKFVVEKKKFDKIEKLAKSLKLDLC